jgi:hypothetical protein
MLIVHSLYALFPIASTLLLSLSDAPPFLSTFRTSFATLLFRAPSTYSTEPVPPQSAYSSPSGSIPSFPPTPLHALSPIALSTQSLSAFAPTQQPFVTLVHAFLHFVVVVISSSVCLAPAFSRLSLGFVCEQPLVKRSFLLPFAVLA